MQSTNLQLTEKLQAFADEKERILKDCGVQNSKLLQQIQSLQEVRNELRLLIAMRDLDDYNQCSMCITFRRSGCWKLR